MASAGRIEDVRGMAARLNLTWLKDSAPALLMEAEEGDLTHLELLERSLGGEIRAREEKAARRRVSQACLPPDLTLEGYDPGFNGCVSEREVRALAELKWVDGHFNLLFLGPPGTGKTHLAAALGLEAALQGYSVSFVGMSELLDLLKTEEFTAKSRTRLRRIRGSDLVIVDDVGVCTANRKETSLFFGLLSELHGRCSIVITSNKGAKEWGGVFADEQVLMAGLDRLMYKCDTRHFSGDSYRLKNRRGFLDDSLRQPSGEAAEVDNA